MSHYKKHPLLRKIATRRRRLDSATGRTQGFEFKERWLYLDRVRDASHVGEQVLTTRETEVLYHVARGETDKEIAAKLFLSCRTVSNHVANILSKLAVNNRRDAVKTAFRIGLI